MTIDLESNDCLPYALHLWAWSKLQSLAWIVSFTFSKFPKLYHCIFNTGSQLSFLCPVLLCAWKYFISSIQMTVQVISCWDSFQCRCIGQLSVAIANVQDKQFIRMKDLFCLTVSEISGYGWLVLLQFLLSQSGNIWPENMREEIAQVLRVGVKREGGTVFQHFC